jgi:hypothetical protein
MAKVQSVPRFGGGKTAPAKGRRKQLPLPDPKLTGPFRPFTSDPGWNEAWWWLGMLAAVALFVAVSCWIDVEWHRRWVTRESGILETAQFIFMVMGLALAAQLLFDPFVRRRPLVFAVTLIAALSCLYIGGEEVSWGQHIFFWQDPGLLSEVNDEGEFSIHNMNKAFERTPRTLLELGVLIGGLSFRRYVRSSPASGIAALRCFCRVPFWSRLRCSAGLQAGRHGVEVHRNECPGPRPSEAVEVYLYFFILAYLIVFERRTARSRDSDICANATTGL